MYVTCKRSCRDRRRFFVVAQTAALQGHVWPSPALPYAAHDLRDGTWFGSSNGRIHPQKETSYLSMEVQTSSDIILSIIYAISFEELASASKYIQYIVVSKQKMEIVEPQFALVVRSPPDRVYKWYTVIWCMSYKYHHGRSLLDL